MLAYIHKIVFGLFILSISVVATADQYRLGDKVIPTEQGVFLKLDPGKDDFSGSTNILIRVKEPTDSIRFHAVELKVTNAQLVKDKQRIPLAVKPLAQGMQSVSERKTIEPGQYQLELEFAGPYNRQSVGLYKTFDQGLPYLFTQFQMSDARRAFPVFDEPSFKIPFQLTISSPKAQQVYSNTPEIRRSEENGWITYEFALTPPLPSYLIAMAVGPFEKIPVEGMSVPGHILTPKGKIAQAKYAAKITPEILSTLEDYFGIPYVYKKLDQVALPEFPFGAMENAGLVTYREDVLLLDEKRAQIKDKTKTAIIISHELAHQWFGNLVTMKWWNDLWLNESNATWMASKIVRQLYPEFEYELKLPQNNVMASDARLSTKPIRKPIKTEADIMDGLDLAYSKGGAVLNMVEQWMGSDAFKQGMRLYMEKFRWGNAEAAELWDSLGEASGKNVKAVLKSFTEQSGYPLLSLEIKGKKLQITQQRFANAGVNAPAQTWTLPVSIRYGAGSKQARTSLLLDKKTKSILLEFKPEWVFPDDNGVGYYRWQLSSSNLNQLLEHTDKLTNREKIAVLNNLDALLNAGALSAGELMASTSLFLAEEHPLVVAEALGLLTAMKRPFIDSHNSEQWQKFIVHSATPAANRFGLTPKKDEAAHVTSLRPQLLSLLAKEGKDADLINTAQKNAKQYLKSPESVEPSLAEVYLRIAAHYGNQQFLEETRKTLSNTSDPQRRTKLLNTLGSFDEAKVQQAAMDLILDENITASDVRYLLVLNAQGKSRRQRLQQWVFNNYDALRAKVPPFVVPSVPLYLGGACDTAQLTQLQEFFGKESNRSDGLDRSVAKVTEQINDCINLRQREQKSVDSYLKSLSL